MSEKLAREKRGLSRENIKWLPKASKILEAGGGIDDCLWEEIRGNSFSAEGFLIFRQCPPLLSSLSLSLSLSPSHTHKHIYSALATWEDSKIHKYARLSCLRSLPRPLPALLPAMRT